VSAYNFQRQFAPRILDGSKPHTIRARRKNGYLPKVGERIKLYTGMRTKQCELLREVTVTRVRPIIVHSVQFPGVVLDGRTLRMYEICDLATADGFKNEYAFFDFFREKRGDSFSGYLIEWDPKS